MVLTRIIRTSLLILPLLFASIVPPALHAITPQESAISSRAEMQPDEFAAGLFSTGFDLFYAGPQWFLNALSNPRSRNPFVKSFAFDNTGDRLGAENGYVGTLRDVFDVNLFGNISVFGGSSGSPKTSGVIVSALGGDATWSATPTNANWVPAGGETNWSSGAGNFPGATSGLTNGEKATFTGSSTELTISINSATLNVRDIAFSGSNISSYTIGSTGGNSLLLSNAGSISIVSGTSGANMTETVNAPLVLEPPTAGSAGTYSFSNSSGTSSLILKIGGTVTGGSTSSVNGIALTLSGANTGLNEVSGAISNGGATNGLSLVKSGNGLWILSGNNSYTRGTTVNAGTLRAGSSTALGNGSLSFGNGSTGTFQLNGFNISVTDLSFSQTFSGSPIIENGAGTDATLTVTTTTSDAFAGLLRDGSTGKLGLTLNGGNLILYNTNTYSGDTTINAGTLSFNSATSPTYSGSANNSTIHLGATSGSATATLALGFNPPNNITSPLIVEAGGTGIRLLTSQPSSGTNTFGGPITMNADLLVQSGSNGGPSSFGTFLLNGSSINLNNHVLTVNDTPLGSSPGNVNLQGKVIISAPISGTGGSIVKDGGGTLILQGADNSYTGGTQIGGGILGIDRDLSLGAASGSVQFTSSATLQDTSNNVSLNASRSISIASGATATFDSLSNTFTINGVISGTSGNLNKTGSGTLVLTGANTYTGTTLISNGTLNAAANGALGSGVGGTAVGTSGITVNNGGTLMLSNSSATDRVRSDAPIVLGGGTGANPIFERSGSGTVSEGTGAHRNSAAPLDFTGSSSAGLGALSLQSNATFNFGTDGIGTFTFGTFTANGNTLTILNWTGTASGLGVVSGTDGVDDRLIFSGTPDANLAFINFNGTPASFIVLETGLFYEVVPVPEMSTWVTGALALAAIGFMQRRRIRRLVARRA